MERLQPLKEYFVLCVVHATAAAVPVYPVAHVQSVTEKVLIARLVSVLLAPLYPVNDDEGAVQVERLHARSMLLLQASVWYSPLTHVVQAEQMRLVVAVQAVVWYVLPEQVAVQVEQV